MSSFTYERMPFALEMSLRPRFPSGGSNLQRVEEEIAGGTGIPGSGSGAGLPVMTGGTPVPLCAPRNDMLPGPHSRT